MKNMELKNRAVNWLMTQSERYKTRPYEFTPREVADGVSGTHTAVGQVAEGVVGELVAQGLKIRYVKQGRKRCFELL